MSGRFCVHGFGRDPRDVVTLFDAGALAFIVGAAVIAAGMPGMSPTSLTPGLARFSIRVCRPGMLVMVVRGRAVEGNKVIPHGRGEESCPKWMRGGGKVLVVDAVTRGTTVEASLVVGRKERPRKWRRWWRRLLLLLAAAGVVLIVLCRHGGGVFFQSREGKEFARNFARVIIDAGRSVGSAAGTRCRKRLIYMPPHSMSRDVRACACSPASPVFRQCASHAITQAGKLASRIGFFCVCVCGRTLQNSENLAGCRRQDVWPRVHAHPPFGVEDGEDCSPRPAVSTSAPAHHHSAASPSSKQASVTA